MNEVTLPPSPNWYLSNVLTCSFDGTVAWGARNVIVIATDQNEKGLKYSIIRNAHRDRVTSLAFTPRFEQVDRLLASTGDDNTIKIWNLDTLSIAYSYSLETGKQAIGIDWSYKDALVLYGLSSDGCVFLWNVRFNTLSFISLGRAVVTCLACCPHDSNLVAVGSKGGLVYIINFHGKGTIVYKLRGHDTEIICLSWCPSEKNIISGSQNKDMLLATSGKDRSVFIWRAGGDGRFEIDITLPTTPLDSRQHKSKLNSSIGNWICVRWIEPTLLLASSSWGELISWDLSMINKNKPMCKLIHACHARGLFSIANVPVQNNQDDWRIKLKHRIWTLAQDRQVVCCVLQGNNVQIEYDIPTQGGYVYCIDGCPLDTSRIAFGVGDTMLRLWNLSEPHINSFDITIMWQKIKGKVRAVSWHPEKENMLAYATGEGRVGVFDTNGNKPPVLYRQYHRNTVYTLGWGPSPQKDYVLYSCGEGELVYYDPEKPNQEPTSVLKTECTEFCWKPDLSCLAVGHENGALTFFNRDLKACGYAAFAAKSVHCFAWHPESTATDLTFSPLRNYLAIAFDSSSIIVLDLSSFMEELSQLQNRAEDNLENYDLIRVKEDVTTLNGHVDKVVCLAWSPHFSGHLVSGSYDNTAQVWNVETQELMGTYTEHCGPVLCCMWSPLHADFIITGSADFTLRIWKVTCKEAIMPTGKLQKISTVKKNKKKQNKSHKAKETLDQNGVTKFIDIGPECLLSETKKVQAKEPKKKKCESISYFAKSMKTMNDKTLVLDSITQIVENLQKENGAFQEVEQNTTSSKLFPLFSAKEDFMLLLANEKSAHTAEGRHNTATEMDVWCNSLKQNLEEAAKEKRLNEFLVSLAPSLSIKTWKEMCEIYANQLIAEGNSYKAVSYLLCIHKPYQAIQVFENAHLYKEAYALARSNLDSDDPILESVLKNWAAHHVETGQFEQAAHIYAKLGDFSKASKYLARRRDAATLLTAAELAVLASNEMLSKSLAEQAIIAAITNSEYDVVRNIIAKFPLFKYREIHLHTHKEMMSVISKNIQPDMLQTWLNGQSDDGLLQTLENVCGDCNSYYSDLRQNNSCYTLDNEETLWLMVSYEIALAVACKEREQRLKHIVAALGAVSQFQIIYGKVTGKQPDFLMKIVRNLDSKCPMEEDSIYAKNEYPVSTSLRAYLCLGLICWLIGEETIDESMQSSINLIENLLEDALHQRALKHWLRANEITKLENRLTPALSKQGEDKSESDPDMTALVQELDALKILKKQSSGELVCVPNPVVVYSKANELAEKLLPEDIKQKFLRSVSKVWTHAISE